MNHPFSIQKIPVPLDLSHTSLNAGDAAVAVAIRHNASLLLLNVFEKGVDSSDDFHFFSDHISNSKDVLTALAGRIQYSNEVNRRSFRRKEMLLKPFSETPFFNKGI